MGESRSSFGSKDISFWGSFVLNFNNATGPALVCFPVLFQQAGWLVPLFFIWFVAWASGFVALMIGEAMQRIPGNANLNVRYEYSNLVEHYYGQRAYKVALVAYIMCTLTAALVSIVVVARTLDGCIGTIFGTSYGVEYGHWPPAFVQRMEATEYAGAQWSGESNWVMSLGLLVGMSVCMPLGMLHLDETMWVQKATFIIFAISSAIILGAFANVIHLRDIPRLTPMFTDVSAQIPVAGVIIFANAYMTSIPSWLNEKAPEVSAESAVWWPVWGNAMLTSAISIMGSWAFPLLEFPDGLSGSDRGKPIDGSDDILSFLSSTGWVAALAAQIWGLATLMAGIPVMCINVKYNMISANVCGDRWATFWSVFAPWIVTAFFYEHNILVGLCNWCAVILLGYVNFAVPALVYTRSLSMYPGPLRYPIEEPSVEVNFPQDSCEMYATQNGMFKRLEDICRRLKQMFKVTKRSNISSKRMRDDSARVFIADKGGIAPLPPSTTIVVLPDEISSNFQEDDHDDLREPLLGKSVESVGECKAGLTSLSGPAGIDVKRNVRQAEIHAVPGCMLCYKATFAKVFATGMLLLCTAAVLVTIYGSVWNVVDDADNANAV